MGREQAHRGTLEKGQRLPPTERDAITRERLLASLTEAASPGSSNGGDEPRA